MKLLSEAASRLMGKLNHAENEARQLLPELGRLDIRLHRAFTAVSIDSCMAYLNVERNRMLKEEKQAKSNAGLIRLPALAFYGFASLYRGQKPDWKRAAGSIFAEQPFADIRVALGIDDVKLVNVSAMARGRGMTVGQVIAHLEGRGYRVLSWSEFVGKADNLRMAVLKGEAAHMGLEKAALQDIQALTTN